MKVSPRSGEEVNLFERPKSLIVKVHVVCDDAAAHVEFQRTPLAVADELELMACALVVHRVPKLKDGGVHIMLHACGHCLRSR